jgi:hypothetical protein
MWEVQWFPSGTQIVRDTENPQPHFYVYGPGGADESESDRNRHAVCRSLADYLNGGERPAWLDDMERVTEAYAVSLDHTRITATGPSVDIDPPNCDWRLDDSDDAKNARARLMDRLFLTKQ